MKHLRSTKCKLDDEASINRVINEQLTCAKCKHQFGSVQALNKHVQAQKCSQPGFGQAGAAQRSQHAKGAGHLLHVQLTQIVNKQLSFFKNLNKQLIFIFKM